jgi:polyether ionophore transport system permease protein
MTGTGLLVRLALRRDRIMLAVWVYAFIVTAYASVAGTRSLYPTAVSRLAFAAGAGANRVTVALYGPNADLATLGGLATWKMSALGAVAVAVMSILIVSRHTRGDEDAGRLELVRAGEAGRSAPLAAALGVALIADAATGLLVAVALAIGGLAGVDSLAFGLGLAAVGAMFAAVAAVTAQLAGESQGATGLALGVLGLAYLLRAAGDAADPGSWLRFLSWASPIGWTQQIRPFGPHHWWLLAIAAAFAVAAGAAAAALSRRRDLGAGLVPDRPGPASAARTLRGPLALAWRLQRGPLLAWAAGFALYGFIMGALAHGVTSLVGNSQGARELFTRLGGQRHLESAFLAAVMGIMALLAAFYTVMAAQRLRTEETGQRAEPVLAGAVTRTRWALSHLAIAAGGPVLLMAVTGLTTGIAYGAGAGDPGTQVPRLLGAALAQVPAIWVLAGLTAALFGLAPRLTAAAWAVLAAFLVIGEIGPFIRLSHWGMDLSPFVHVPRLPGAAFSLTPLAWLTAIALALTAAGLAGWRQRDVAGG